MWNNRIFYNPDSSCYGVHETFYNKDGSVYSFTENPISGHYETLDDLIKSHKILIEDIEKTKDSVLDYETMAEFVESALLREDEKESKYKCFDFSLFNVSNDDIEIFQICLIFKGIYFDRSLLSASFNPFKIKEFLFFRFKKSIL